MKLIDADKLREEWVSRLHIINPDSYFAVEQEITDDCIAGFIQSIDEQPSIEIPVTYTGHWDVIGPVMTPYKPYHGNKYRCSICGNELDITNGCRIPKFCDNCGARNER